MPDIQRLGIAHLVDAAAISGDLNDIQTARVGAQTLHRAFSSADFDGDRDGYQDVVDTEFDDLAPATRNLFLDEAVDLLTARQMAADVVGTQPMMLRGRRDDARRGALFDNGRLPVSFAYEIVDVVGSRMAARARSEHNPSAPRVTPADVLDRLDARAPDIARSVAPSIFSRWTRSFGQSAPARPDLTVDLGGLNEFWRKQSLGNLLETKLLAVEAPFGTDSRTVKIDPRKFTYAELPPEVSEAIVTHALGAIDQLSLHLLRGGQPHEFTYERPGRLDGILDHVFGDRERSFGADDFSKVVAAYAATEITSDRPDDGDTAPQMTTPLVQLVGRDGP